MSKTQIDRLGDRLRKGNITEDDIRLLDQYRRSFTESYEIVIGRIRRELSLEPTGRPAKSTTSISDKLRRESIRLTQIQDIAGCRLIVENIAEQDKVVKSLASLFEDVDVVDRRQKPSHGYRAVHVIANCNNKLIEVQVRTELQHLWAEVSEKLSDVIDSAIKYGGGDENIRSLLIAESGMVANVEEAEATLAEVEKILTDVQARIPLQIDLEGKNTQEVADIKNKVDSSRVNLISLRQKSSQILRDTITHAETLQGGHDALPD